MKKIKILEVLGIAVVLSACASTNSAKSKNTNPYVSIQAGRADITNVSYEESAVQYGKNVDEYTNVTIINGAKSNARNLVVVDLADYEGMEVDLSFSCDLKVVDKTGNTTDVIWMINEPDAGFPQVDRQYVPSGEWVHFSGSKTVALSGKRQLYVSSAGLAKENLTVYIKNFRVVLLADQIGKDKVVAVEWTKAPSLIEAYKNYFDYIGFATPYNGVLNSSEVFEGLPHQANCITMENEFKPDFVFAWQKPSSYVDFTAEDGKVYKMPSNVPSFNDMDKILRIAKTMGIKMRGHVLVWHAQTPDWFFKEGFKSSGAMVDVSTMNARLEWYIKTVLTHIKDWEIKNNNGEHIVIAWDVVNEAASDNSTAKQWLRTDSNWYRIFKDDTFIVNAFRYANKYAPKDILLCYNDYGCSSTAKSFAICKIVDAIQAAPDARIDVVGMQSHIGLNTSVAAFETSVKKFLAKGVDVQITELDIGQDGQNYNSEKMKNKYKEFFTMFLKNRRVEGKNGIRGVTFWGICDERSWIYNSNGKKQHPLLFEKNYLCKPAFYGVLEAAQEFAE